MQGGDAKTISLYDFQREDVDYLETQASVLIANEMGKQAPARPTKLSSEISAFVRVLTHYGSLSGVPHSS